MAHDSADVGVFGDINVDVVARLDAPLAPGGDNLSETLDLHLGGVAANTAVALAKWGLRVRLVGSVGQDWFGDFALQQLAACGVDVSGVSRAPQLTGLIFIPVDPGGRRTIIGSRGANAIAPEAPPLGRAKSGARWLHLVGYTLLSPKTAKLMMHLLEEARQNGIRASLDAGLAPSQQAGEQIRRLAPQLEALFLGLEEAEALTGKRGAEALEAAARLGAREVIIKCGADGCRYFENGSWQEVAPFAVQAVDTTGAGDAFAAGFIVARLRAWPTADAALLANAMGAAAACVAGAGTAMPGPREVTRMLSEDSCGRAAHSASVRILELLGGPSQQGQKAEEQR